MDGVKWRIDLESHDELPQPVEVSRAMFATSDFDTRTFLTSVSDFRSLKDVHEAVQHWETRFRHELSETVNANFDDFVNSVGSVSSGEASLNSIQADVHKFVSSTEKEHLELVAKGDAIERGLALHKKLCQQEGDAHRLLHMFDLLAELEAVVPELGHEPDDLVSVSRSYVAMVSIAVEFSRVKAVRVLAVSMAGIQQEIIARLRQAIAQTSEYNTKLEFAEAHEWVSSTNVPF